MPANVIIRQFYPQVLDETGVPGDPLAPSYDTFAAFDRPYMGGQVQVIGFQAANVGDASLPGARVHARVTTFNPPEVSSLPNWRDNAARHIIPRIELSADGSTYLPAGSDLGIGTLAAGGTQSFWARYTSAVTDTRTGTPYNYASTANPNDHPYAFALQVLGAAGRSWAAVVGA
jgi:hypothetical protein